jgi:hypothetical protein
MEESTEYTTTPDPASIQAQIVQRLQAQLIIDSKISRLQEMRQRQQIEIEKLMKQLS